MHLKRTITFATITAILLDVGCGSTKRSTLPSISADNTPFIRITDIASRDLVFAAVEGLATPTKETVVNEVKRQRVVGTITLEKGDLYIPQLVDHKDPKSILTIDSGAETWALIEAAVWDDVRHNAVVTAGFIPLNEYERYLRRSGLGKREKN